METLKKVLRIAVDNKFVINGKDGNVTRMPVIIPIICALINIVITAIVLIAGMASGLRYTVEGKELGTQSVNDGMKKAGEYTQNIVNDITSKKSNVQSEAAQNQ